MGYRLTVRDGRAESRIAAAEKRLGVGVPKALRDYYLVAGGERRFNHIFDRLLAPSEWFVDSGHLVFMEENQAVVFWGTVATADPAPDPPVFQGVNGDPIEWYQEHEKCSVFLLVTLHWHGAFGGAMRWADTAAVDPQLVRHLDRHWRFAGEVNAMRAYNRPGQAVCFLQWDDSWRVFGGTSTKDGLAEMAKDLGLEWDGYAA